MRYSQECIASLVVKVTHTGQVPHVVAREVLETRTCLLT
jgi:hypothetical protein